MTRLALLDGEGATGLNVADLVEPRSSRFASLALKRAVSGVLRGHSVQVLTPEDFLLFKVLSTRDRDLEDAGTVVRALRGRLDLPMLRSEAERLAREIPDHEVLPRLARILPGPD